MSRFLILGAGLFGQLALERLLIRHPQAAFLLVDQKVANLRRGGGKVPQIIRVAGDAVTWLELWLAGGLPLDWIIPAVPVHVAFVWLWRRRPQNDSWQIQPVPPGVGEGAPLAIQGPQGELYLSLAAARCPDDCSEAFPKCPHPGRAELGALHETLARTEIPGFPIRVVRSHQLAPGVGGYPPASLLELWEWIQATPGNFLVATACRCHGVVHAVRRT